MTFRWSVVLGILVCVSPLNSGCSSAARPQADVGQTNPDAGPARPDAGPTVSISIDWTQEKGTFSNYLFAADDLSFFSAEGYQLASAAGIRAVTFNTATNSFLPYSMQKAELLAQYGLEGILYVLMTEPLSAAQLETQAATLLDELKRVKQAYPQLVMKTFLLGNEPDLAQLNFWKGTPEQFFANFAVLAKYLKARDPGLVVGGPGVSGEPLTGDAAAAWTTWVEAFFQYLHQNQVPLDFFAFHSYSTEVRTLFVDRLEYFKGLVARYPDLSPLYGTPRLANSEWDIIASPCHGSNPYYPELDTAWRAAHNILALSAMADHDLWMSDEMGGPFFNPSDPSMDCLWVKVDKTPKPVYWGHAAFNALAGTVRLASQGANFETLSVIAGKSPDGNSITVVAANYDQKAYLALYPLQRPAVPGILPEDPAQSADAEVYGSYHLEIRNLPWPAGTKVKLERKLVDAQHSLEVVESSEITAGPSLVLERETHTPEVQLITLRQMR